MKHEPWVSLEEIAGHLGVSQDTVHRWIRERDMPALQVQGLKELMTGSGSTRYRDKSRKPG